jgi:hypothetical protein
MPIAADKTTNDIVAKSVQLLIQSFCMRLRHLDPVLNAIIAQAFEDTALMLEASVCSSPNRSEQEFARKILGQIEDMRDQVFRAASTSDAVESLN